MVKYGKDPSELHFLSLLPGPDCGNLITETFGKGLTVLQYYFCLGPPVLDIWKLCPVRIYSFTGHLKFSPDMSSEYKYLCL